MRCLDPAPRKYAYLPGRGNPQRWRPGDEPTAAGAPGDHYPAAAAGRNNDQIARQYGLAREMVQTWRRRWLAAAPRLAAAEAGGGTAAELTQQIVAVLADQPRAGVPPTFSAEQICQILALACQPPAASGGR